MDNSANRLLDHLRRNWLIHTVLTTIGGANVIAAAYLAPSAYQRGLVMVAGFAVVLAAQWVVVVRLNQPRRPRSVFDEAALTSWAAAISLMVFVFTLSHL